ncbi:cache domain-containing sensor histidine kinase [Paenibacillus hexagrammi]|uniref:histidine kinase n=1 Tax=Paenibacillus hexagrammi TaxID=2908839 RepID=A0ABY3SN14_9BACL|nr:sensor histidine kinase [Paenibacillus sp. YPD9-1]UJF34815.1 sensor histidine kinase [Paenibacillus sp. YPD9-1]
MNDWTRLFRRSLHVKLTAASIAVMLLSIVIIVGFGYNSVHVILKENMSRYMEENINKANENFDMIVQDADRMNAIISMNESLVMNGLERESFIPDMDWFNSTKQINTSLDSLFSMKENLYIGISVLGNNGQLYKAGSPRVNGETFHEPWVSQVMKSQSSVLLKRETGAYGLSESDNYVLTVARAIRRYGEIKGIVLTDIDYNVLKDIYSLKDKPEAEFLLLDENRKVVFDSAEPSSSKDEPEHSDQETMVVESTSPISHWTARAVISNEVLLKEFYKFTREMFIVVITIVLVCLLLLTIVIRKITRNIKELRNAMEAVKRGNLAATPHIQSPDEIGQLSRMFVSMMNQVQRLLDDISRKEHEKREAELQALHSQINPHFLCNTLNTIRFLAQLQNITNISEVSASLIRLLRITIDNKERYITMEDELTHVKSYLTIQRYKYMDKISTEFYVQDEVLACKTIKMIVQPLVENAIIHGIEPSGRDGVITIKVYADEGQVIVKVTDNGLGMTHEQIEQIMHGKPKLSGSRFSGIGIPNIQQRLNMFYGDAGRVRVYSQPGMFTSVEVAWPAHV